MVAALTGQSQIAYGITTTVMPGLDMLYRKDRTPNLVGPSNLFTPTHNTLPHKLRRWTLPPERESMVGCGDNALQR